MDEIRQLESFGLDLPSPLFIVGAILFGVIGYVAFRRGRKATLSRLTWAGIALMVYPYAVSQAWLLWLVGVCLCGYVYFIWE